MILSGGRCVLTAFCYISSATIVAADYYSAVSQLSGVLKLESQIIEAVDKYFQAENAKRQYIEEFLDMVEDDVADADENAVNYYSNPLTALKVIKRIVHDWRDLYKFTIQQHNELEYVKQLEHLAVGNVRWPNADDHMGVAKGVARLQSMYKVAANEFANGTLLGRRVSSAMHASDCYYLGNRLLDANNYQQAVPWLLEARRRLAEETDAKSTMFSVLNENMILQSLAPAALQINNPALSVLLLQEHLKNEPKSKEAKANLAKVQHIIRNNRMMAPSTDVRGITAERARARVLYTKKEQANAKAKDRVRTTYRAPPQPLTLTELYQGTCSGELRPTAQQQRPLRCRYVHNAVPFCYLARLRREELSLDPFIVYYHNVIYDKEIKHIINYAQNQIQRSKIGINPDKSVVSDIRTSKNTWLVLREHKFGKTLGKRLQDITGLTLHTAEALQVANYGIGGHYDVHYDFSEDLNTFVGIGNRIATAMFYLSNVEMGGATAFPYLQLAVPPVKGSLVFWYNLHTSLELDYRMKHAACPVLTGSKWICNEWFHAYGNELFRPCGLKQDGHKSIKYSTR